MTEVEPREVLSNIAERRWKLSADSTPRAYDPADSIINGLFDAGLKIVERPKYEDLHPDVGRIVRNGVVVGHVVDWEVSEETAGRIDVQWRDEGNRRETFSSVADVLECNAGSTIEWIT